MKKLSKIFAVVLTLALVLSMLPLGASAAAETMTFDFTTLTGTGTRVDDEQLAFMNGCTTGTYLTAATLDRIYNGTGSGGAYPDSAGYVKTGTGSVEADMQLTFSKKVTKVEIVCHDFYKKSDAYPTNTNQVAVNNGTAQLAPYTENADFATLTFVLDTASENVNIHVSNTATTASTNKGGRIYIKSITVTFEETTTGGETGGETGGDNTNQNPDNTGDNTAIVAMTTVMVMSVAALAVLVIGKKRMF